MWAAVERRFGEVVGDGDPHPIAAQVFKNAELAAVRFRMDETPVGVLARLAREEGFLASLQRRDIPSNPHWVAGRSVSMEPVKAGQFTLLDLSLGHSCQLFASIDSFAMHVSREALDRHADEQGARRIYSMQTPIGIPADDPVVAHLGECLRFVVDEPEKSNRLFADHVSMALITHLATAYGEMRLKQPRKRGGLAPWQERCAKERMMENIDGDIGLDELAQLCRLSRSHFARAFKVSVGVPPHRWLLMQRVERARDLLLNSYLSIEEVGVRCGFADQSHFTRVFARAFGVGPGEWRRCRRS